MAVGAVAVQVSLAATAFAADDGVGRAPRVSLTPLAEASYGAPPVPPRPEQMRFRVTREEATKAVLPEAVAYYASEFGVGRDVARYRLATQGMVPSIGPVLRALLGDGYADVWWDDETGELVVLATAAASREAIDDALRERNLTPDTYRVERVAYDNEQLLAAGERTTKRLASPIAAGQAKVGVAAGRVTVELASDTGAAQRADVRSIAAAESRSAGGVPVRTSVSDARSLGAEPAACSTTVGIGGLSHFCDDLIGGARFWNGGASCSFSWYVAMYNRNPWVPSYLTSGHCLNREPLVANQYTCRSNAWTCGSIGLSLQYFYGYGRSDAGMIDVYAPTWKLYGGWYNWSINTTSPRTGLEWTAPGAGYVLCKNGATSGSSCGTVQYSSVTVTYSDATLSNMIQARDLTVCSGDSGGPWHGAGVANAVGITSGTAYVPGTNCGTTSFAAPIWEPLYYFNLDIYSGGPHGPY
jgi:hypothetical protein